VGIWGGVDDEIDLEKYPILMASENEKSAIDSIAEKDRMVVFNYCTRAREDYVIRHWRNVVPTIFGFPPAADTSIFYPEEPTPELAADLMFCGGYWGYKGQNLDQFIIPLCYPVGKYKIRIFGNQHWPVPQYMGFIHDDTLRKVICSTTVCPSVHEPHSNAFGFDILSRVFNIIACKGFCISDYVASWVEDIFTNGELICTDDPEEYLGYVDDFVKNPDARTQFIEDAHAVVMEKHTYKNRVRDILEVLGYDT
jgi:hypothetical protein